jgi:hypothetical protein
VNDACFYSTLKATSSTCSEALPIIAAQQIAGSVRARARSLASLSRVLVRHSVRPVDSGISAGRSVARKPASWSSTAASWSVVILRPRSYGRARSGPRHRLLRTGRGGRQRRAQRSSAGLDGRSTLGTPRRLTHRQRRRSSFAPVTSLASLRLASRRSSQAGWGRRAAGRGRRSR